MKDAEAKFTIRAIDETRKAFSSVRRGLNNISGQVKALAAGMAVLGLASLRLAADFEQGMNEVNSLINLPRHELNALKEDVRALSVEMGTDLQGNVRALYQAISAGVSSDNAISFLREATKASVAGVTDVEVAVDALTTVLNAYQMDISETARVSDMLFTAVKGGKTTFAELADTLNQVAPISAALGIEFAEVTAGIATLTKQGAPTAQAVNQLRSAIVALTKPNKDMAELLNRVGFESGLAAIKSKGFAGTLKILRSETGASEEELAKAFGRVEALNAVLGLTGKNAETFASDYSAAMESAGAATTAFEENNQGVNRTIGELSAMLKDELIPLGESLAVVLIENKDSIVSLIETFGELTKAGIVVVGWFSDLIKTGQEWLEIIFEVTQLPSIFEAIGNVVGKVGEELSALPETMRFAINLITEETDRLAEKPVELGPVVVGQKPPEIAGKEAGMEVVKGFVEGVDQATDQINKGISPDSLKLTREEMVQVDEILNQYGSSLDAQFRAFAEEMREGEQLARSLRTAQEIYNDSIERYSHLLDNGRISQETYNRAIADAESELKKANDATKDLDDSSFDLAEHGLGAIDNALRRNMDSWQDWASVALDLIGEVFSNANKGEGLFGGIGGPQFGVGGGSGGIGGALSGIGSLFGGFFADGGRPPMGKVSMVGERGPELFVPDRPGTIVPNHAMQGNAGSSIHYAPVYNIDSRTDRADVIAAIEEGNRRNIKELKNMILDGGSTSEVFRM